MKFQTATGTGPVPIEEVRWAAAHAYLWIDPPEGVASEARLMQNFARYLAWQAAYRLTHRNTSWILVRRKGSKPNGSF